MTNADLEKLAGQHIELFCEGRLLRGRLVVDGEAQICDTPYAIKTLVKNPSFGTNEPRYEGIPYAEAVEWAKPI